MLDGRRVTMETDSTCVSGGIGSVSYAVQGDAV